MGFRAGGVRRRQDLRGRAGWKRFIFVFGEGEDGAGRIDFGPKRSMNKRYLLR